MGTVTQANFTPPVLEYKSAVRFKLMDLYLNTKNTYLARLFLDELRYMNRIQSGDLYLTIHSSLIRRYNEKLHNTR